MVEGNDTGSGKGRDARIDGTNRDYIDYEQVKKQQSYRFAEAEQDLEEGGSEAFDTETPIHTCDFSRYLHGDAAERAACARELGSALEGIGFAILVNHGVDAQLYERAEQEVRKIFTTNSLESKLRFRARRHGSINQGYFPIQETSDIHPDLVEGWVFCRRAFAELSPAEVALEDFWPALEHETVFRALCQAQERLVQPIARCLLQHLGCEPGLLDKRLAGTNFGLRLNYYPPIPEGAPRGAGRLLGHEDVDLFTLLPAPRCEGLQVLNRRNFRWIRLTAPANALILNTGDYLQRISNDRYPSTTHRVSRPRDPRLKQSDRVSFPMNIYLSEEELLEVLPGLANPKYPPVRAIEFHTRTTAKHYGDNYAVDSEA